MSELGGREQFERVVVGRSGGDGHERARSGMTERRFGPVYLRHATRSFRAPPWPSIIMTGPADGRRVQSSPPRPPSSR
jgi:hypothetical protein